MLKIEWPTAVVVVAGIAAMVALAYLKVDPKWIAGAASALIALAGGLEKLFQGKANQ